MPSARPKLPPPATSCTNVNNDGFFSRVRSRLRLPLASVYIQDFFDELRSRDIHARLRAQREREEPQITQAELASAIFDGTTGDSGNEGHTAIPDAVRFSVFIAMPDPAKPSHKSHIHCGESDSMSSTSSVKGKERASVADQSTVGEDGEVPYIEIGVTEIGLSRPPASRGDE